MLARKLKCTVCGGNKINEISTAYIYCDYCSNFMGYDMSVMTGNASEIFSTENYKGEKQQAYLAAGIEMGKALKEKNAEAFIKANTRQQEIMFDLFPFLYSPKAKQPAYRKKYIDYLRLYWEEQIQNNYFEENEKTGAKFNELSKNLKYTLVNNKIRYEWNDEFEAYVGELSNFIRSSVDKTMRMKCLEHYPDPVNDATPDLLYKQGINSMIQNFDAETATKIIGFLGLKEEYLEVEDINISKISCCACNSELNVPDHAESMLCESCGSINKIKNREIQCLNCGAPFSPAETKACPFCGAKLHVIGNDHDKNNKAGHEQTKKEAPKKGFFGKLFGKK